MIFHEMEVWACWAAQDSVNAIAQVAVDAMDAWPMRMCGGQELADLAPWCQNDWVGPAQRSKAAALAASELAIICHIWPEPLDEVLRPAGITLSTGRGNRFARQRRRRRGAAVQMIPPIILAAQPVGYLLHRAAELRAMALTARTIEVAASFVRWAERFEEMAEARISRALAAGERAHEQATVVAGIVGRLATLTPRERAVLALLVTGRPNKVVASDLGTSPRTIEVHRARVMEKMGARSLSELVRMAIAADHGG